MHSYRIEAFVVTPGLGLKRLVMSCKFLREVVVGKVDGSISFAVHHPVCHAVP